MTLGARKRLMRLLVRRKSVALLSSSPCRFFSARRPLSLLFAASSASAANIPVLTPDVPACGGATPALRAAHDGPRTVDGDPRDWRGSLPGFGGALFYSRGELVYEDHGFDAYGADNGQDAQRMAI